MRFYECFDFEVQIYFEDVQKILLNIILKSSFFTNHTPFESIFMMEHAE